MDVEETLTPEQPGVAIITLVDPIGLRAGQAIELREGGIENGREHPGLCVARGVIRSVTPSS